MQNFFSIKELVPPEIYEAEGNEAWSLIDPRLIETLNWIRANLNRVITVNNWAFNGQYKYRGFRPKDCAIGAVKSAHKEGLAADFDVKGMTADQVRDWLSKNEHSLPYPIRCEEGVNWVHIDLRAKTGYQLYFFEP